MPDTPIADVIASGVHDTKNVLFDSLQRIAAAARKIGNGGDGGNAEALALLQEASRSIEQGADRLSTVLSAYRLARHENPVAMLPTPVVDLIESVALRNASHLHEQRNIRVELGDVCNEAWLLDRELVADTLNNAVENALRHAASRVLISAYVEEDWHVIQVEDDGPGFSDEMLAGKPHLRTGVGLYVAGRIAALHVRHGRHGKLSLANGGALGGAIFRIFLP